MSASLVGSEMCIRDRRRDIARAGAVHAVSDDGIDFIQRECDTGPHGQGGPASWGQLTHLK
eukprot:8582563-Alexandrium_andersonii.AAC.1